MSTIVFDFDGTLADSFLVMLGIYNDLAKLKGFRQATEADWQKLRIGTIGSGLKWAGINPIQVPGLLTLGLRMVEKRTAEIKLFPEMVKLVDQLAAEGHQLFVLSTNSQALIQEVLNKHGIGEQLDVLKSSRLFGKAQALRKLMRSHRLDPQSVWMIGDEVRDMRAAKRAGVQAAGVAWGFQPEATLVAVGDIHIVKQPKDILKLVS